MVKFLNNVDLAGVAKIVNTPAPKDANDLVTKSFVEDAIQKAIAGFDFQADVLAVQSDETFKVTTPKKGDRYIIKDASKLDASLGTIEGLESNDIIEYDGSKFVVVYDVSVKGDGIFLYCQQDKEYFKFVNNVWSFGGLTVIKAGNGLNNANGTFSVNIDNKSIGFNEDNQLKLLANGVKKENIDGSVAGKALVKDVDGTLGVRSKDPRIGVDGDGIKLTETYTRKFATNIGDGTTKSFTFSHGLKSKDVLVQVVDSSTFANVQPDIARPDDDTVTVTFSEAPSTNQYRVIVIG